MSRKDGILKVATELFKYHGKSKTSIRQIAQKASVSHSLLHKHWISKDDLYLDCLIKEVEDLTSLLSSNGDRAELTVYYLMKHPHKWSLIARCLAAPPPANGEERRFEAKVTKTIKPVMDHLLEVSTNMAKRKESGDLENSQIGKTWFFLIMSIFSGHCLMLRCLKEYLGEADLRAARRITIDAFYENCVFNRKELLR
tara:strand:+ start:919 stop:1512 length:594 start_codon:yes stop_codon:yes gene_type:complete